MHWGFDETTQKFTGSAVDNNGGLNTPLESDGMQGDAIVWRGTAPTAAGGGRILSRSRLAHRPPRSPTWTAGL